MQTECLRCTHGSTQLTPTLCDSPIKSEETSTLREAIKVKIVSEYTYKLLTSKRANTSSRESLWTAAAIRRDLRAWETVNPT